MSEPLPGERPLARLHPSSILFQILRTLRGLLGPAIALLVFSPGGGADLWFPIVAAAGVLPGAVRYWTYRYRLGAGELTVREGILFRSERRIPYGRIQNLNLVRNPLHRALGVAEVHVETAGGAKPEAILRVLSLDRVAELRSHVFADRAPAAGSEDGERQAPAEEELVRLSAGDVALFGFLSNKGTVLVAAAVGALTQVVPDSFWNGQAERLASALGEPGWLDPSDLPRRTQVVLIAVVVLPLLWLVLRALSVAWGFLKYHGFRLVRDGLDLRAEYGLLTRITATVPRRRVQLFHVREGWMQRRLGKAAVQVETAGGAGGSDDDEKGAVDQVWIAPIVDTARVAGLLDEVLPGHGLGAAAWRPLAPGAFARLAKRYVLLALALAAVTAPTLRLWAAAVAAVTVPVALFAARAYVRNARWTSTDAAVAFRSGWWTRRTSVVPVAKVQVVSLLESPFDRRRRMARVRVDTAGAGRVGHRVDVRYLEGEVARGLHDVLARRAAATTFRW